MCEAHLVPFMDTCWEITAVIESKYQNIKKGIYFYLQEKNIKYDKFRIDVISVTLKPELKIEHLENI